MATTEIKHIGMCAYRLAREPLERVYAEVWAQEAPNTLRYLLYGQDSSKHDVTPRDAEIAATVIQWLGSSVGQSFLAEVKIRAKETL